MKLYVIGALIMEIERRLKKKGVLLYEELAERPSVGSIRRDRLLGQGWKSEGWDDGQTLELIDPPVKPPPDPDRVLKHYGLSRLLQMVRDGIEIKAAADAIEKKEQTLAARIRRAIDALTR